MNTPDRAPLIDPTAWIRAIDEALDRIAQDTLCVGPCVVEAEEALTQKTGIRGAYISLVDGDVSVLLGMRGPSSACETLTRYMMAMDDDEEVADEDITGAIGEVMNIMAGVVKSEMRQPTLRLGIPMVVSGRVTPAAQQETSCRVIQLGDARVEVLLLHRSRRPIVRRLRHAS